MGNKVADGQLEFDIGLDEKETDIELPEDKNEDDGGNASSFEAAPAAQTKQGDDDGQSHSDELDSVSENVRKRISKLTAKMREAERREQAALEYARGVQAQAEQLKVRLVATDQSRLTETKTRLDTQQATLRAIIKKAREEGDIDTETEAQEKLAEVLYEQRRVAEWTENQQFQQQQQPAARQPAAQAPQQAQVPAKPKPSARAQEWAEANSWFGKDKMMTYAAWGIHAELVEEEGLDPESDDYYTELDNRIRAEFPQRFQQSNSASNSQRQRANVPPVAPANRGSGVNNARRTVRLSPSQVAIAKKLGVPLEEYAKYVKE